MTIFFYSKIYHLKPRIVLQVHWHENKFQTSGCVCALYEYYAIIAFYVQCTHCDDLIRIMVIAIMEKTIQMIVEMAHSLSSCLGLENCFPKKQCYL